MWKQKWQWLKTKVENISRYVLDILHRLQTGFNKQHDLLINNDHIERRQGEVSTNFMNGQVSNSTEASSSSGGFVITLYFVINKQR